MSPIERARARYWGVRKIRHSTGFARSLRKRRPFKCTWRSCLAWQLCNTKMDVVLAGLNDTPSGCQLGPSWAYSEGTLDEEEYILLSLGLELGDARSYFALPQEIPVRPLLALDETTFLSRFRFTEPQVEAIHGALALPADFERKRHAPGRVVNTDREMYADSQTHCQRKCCSSKARVLCEFRRIFVTIVVWSATNEIS